jgi:replicative DNA helicase
MADQRNRPAGRMPPHSEEAEVSVLGSILIDREAIVDVAEFLKPEHFYRESNGLIFEAMLLLYEKREPIDVLTVREQLKKMHAIKQVGGADALSNLVEQVPTASNTKHYGMIVKDNYTKRRLISMAADVTDLAFDDGGEVAQVLDKAEQSIFSLSQQHLKQVFIPIKEALAESFDRLDELHKNSEGMRGVPTGFKDLDNCLAGMQNSNLIIMAARPGMGKTAFSLNICQTSPSSKKCRWVFSRWK